jgi:hypothetical protein
MRNMTMRFTWLHYAVLSFAIGLSCATALAQDCLDYVTTGPQVVYEDASGYATAIAVAGDRAYVAASGGIRVYDVSDPADATLLGTMPAAGYIPDLAVDSGRLYVCSRTAGLIIAAVSPDGMPAVIAQIAMPDGAQEVVIDGDLAYVAAGTAGLAIYDLGDPANPQHLATTVGAAPFYYLALDGDVIHGGCRGAGIQSVDVADPAHPVVGSLIDVGGWVISVAIHAGDLYVGTSEGDLLAFDLSPSASPALRGTLRVPDHVSAITDREGALWICGTQTGLVEIDTSDPSAPAVADFVENPGQANEAEHVGALTYVAGVPALRILDLAHPAPDFTIGWFTEPLAPGSVAVRGSRAYIPDGLADVLITVDVTDLRHPIEIAHCPLTSDDGEIVLAGDHAFVAAWNDGIHVMDLADPDHPELVTTLALDGSVAHLAVSGSVLLASVVHGLHEILAVIDVSNWREPVLVGSVAAYGPSHLAVSGTIAVVACDLGLRIVDFSHPTAPVVVASWATGHHFADVAMAGNTVYACDLDGAVTILDVTVPALPVAIGQCATRPDTYALECRGDTLYLASAYAGVLAVDITDPAHPEYIGAAPVAGAVTGFAVTDDAIFAVTMDDLVVTLPACFETLTSIAPTALAATSIAASPNPFNPRTVIRFDLTAAGTAALDIVDIRGRVVRHLVSPAGLAAGSHGYTWNGYDDDGRNLPTGVYFARLTAGAASAVTKVLLLR